MDKHKVLDQLLMELHHFLLILDKETLSGNATIHKGLLTDLLQSYSASNGGDEEYIYMNKVVVGGKEKQEKDDRTDDLVNGKASKHAPVPQKSLPNLPPPRTSALTREPFPLPVVPAQNSLEMSESYYEEAQPYEETVNDMYGLLSRRQLRVASSDSIVYAVITREDGEAVSSSYESYDEEEVTRGKSAQHQWPSTEASIELMKDARICAFLWRKKWLGQWAKQLCVIREHRLLCYKSSKEQTPLLDVSLLGCSVTYKEKQLKRKEHKLKIVPVGGEAIVLGLQSKEQTEQWLRVIQEISPKPTENGDIQHCVTDSPRLICTKMEVGDRHSVASESGSSNEGHAETNENKDVKKKYSAGLKFSNLMNIGKKKASSFENAEKCVDTSGYLNVLVNSQWRTCWCLIKNGQLWFYQDKNKTKVSQPAVTLEGCQVSPDPSPEHLYSFRIDMEGTQLATLEAKTSAVMGHWLGLLLSQMSSKTDPEELTYDYVNAERITSIVNAAKTSLYLMQRRYSEPNAYIDALPSTPEDQEELYDDLENNKNLKFWPNFTQLKPIYILRIKSVKPKSALRPKPTKLSIDSVQTFTSTTSLPDLHIIQDAVDGGAPQDKETAGNSEETSAQDQKDPVAEDADPENRIYLDLVPVRSFLHTVGSSKDFQTQGSTDTSEENVDSSSLTKEVRSTNLPESAPALNNLSCTPATTREEQERPLSPTQSCPQTPPNAKTPPQSQEPVKKTFSSSGVPKGLALQTSTGFTPSTQTPRPKTYSSACPGTVEGKLGKNRTEADLRRYIDERDRLEREREEERSSLASLKKERREIKEELSACQDSKRQALLEARLKQVEEASREAEHRRVEVELLLVEVKENLKKVEAGPFTLGTTMDCSLQDTAKTVSMPPAQMSLSPASSPSQPSSSPTITSVDSESPVNSASALKNRPVSIMATKGKVLQKAKEWERKSTA
ncbi:actin filament-associated protein 1-like 2 [Nerophis ophidion]|uniref:actin filament-associated protein 1-like 2 n=1 Tax=Nerophis ophidion TaxID=159077 RepID=UPI002ADFCD4E|nr:actin filament-associated protein 1-like 2 [Nerophis ophidion]